MAGHHETTSSRPYHHWFFSEPLVLLQPLRWRCVDCVIHHEQDVREEQKYIWVARASNNKRDCDVKALPILTCERLNMMTGVRKEIATHDLHCCLLPRCEALSTCRSGFPIATVSCFHSLNVIHPGSHLWHQGFPKNIGVNEKIHL